MENPDLARYISQLTIPGDECGQDITVRIGPCPYRRQRGIYVSKTYGELCASALMLDGTWTKYGEAFPSIDAAYEALLSTPYRSEGVSGCG